MAVMAFLIPVAGAFFRAVGVGIRDIRAEVMESLRPPEPEHSKAWQNGWDDVMDGTVIVGSKEHREQLDDGKLPVVYTNRGGHITAAKRSSRNVSTYTTEEWNDYMDGRSAATDEKNRRDIVLRARVDQIDADNEKQARYLEALEELRSEYRQ